MSYLYNRKRKTSRRTTVPQSFLQRLAGAVTFCINFRIQHCHLPPELHASALTWDLASRIRILQGELRSSIRADYERQKADILDKRNNTGE